MIYFFRVLILFWCCLGWQFVSAQEDSTRKKISDIVQIKGYVKDLQIFSFSDDARTTITNNLFHNRLNFKIKPINSLIVGIEVRTRLFAGDNVRLTRNFGRIIGKDTGVVDMSYTVVDKPPVILHTILDRLYIDWTKGKWNLRAGRQRINWGINLAWNPNDIFNTYNFLDFDYEECPGADAIKVQYNVTAFKSIEIAVKPARSLEHSVTAVKYAFNQKNYDIQVIAGKFIKDIMIGLGWAGNLGNAGFKGEISYFHEYTLPFHSGNALSVATGLDRSFSKGWYINGTFLYNSISTNKLNFGFSAQPTLTNLSAKQLMPTRFNFLVQLSKQISPLTTAGLVAVFAPQANLLIISPHISHSIENNWDIDLTVQSFFVDVPPHVLQNLDNIITLRLRYSFSN